MAHTYNPSTLGGRGRKSNEFEASLNYIIESLTLFQKVKKVKVFALSTKLRSCFRVFIDSHLARFLVITVVFFMKQRAKATTWWSFGDCQNTKVAHFQKTHRI